VGKLIQLALNTVLYSFRDSKVVAIHHAQKSEGCACRHLSSARIRTGHRIFAFDIGGKRGTSLLLDGLDLHL
jgi:hypothetical protein